MKETTISDKPRGFPWRVRDKVRLALIFVMAAAIFSFHFFLDGVWVNLALKIYLLTALLFGWLLVDSYPPFATARFLKVMTLVVPGHLVVLALVVWVSLKFPGLDHLPRAEYGVLSVILAFEAKMSWRILE